MPGRGRPRKYPVEEKKSSSKRGRGRPRKYPVEEKKSSAKRGRGRPRKHPVEEKKTSPKRGRGRPRKYPVEEKKTSAKRGRGRPRKVSFEEKKTSSKKNRYAKIKRSSPKGLHMGGRGNEHEKATVYYYMDQGGYSKFVITQDNNPPNVEEYLVEQRRSELKGNQYLIIPNENNEDYEEDDYVISDNYEDYDINVNDIYDFNAALNKGVIII